MPRSFGQVFAQGAGGAEQSLAGSEAVGASRLAAQQAYEEKQQELQIARIREAIPLLQLQANQRALAGMTPPGTSIATAGAPPANVPAGAYGAGGPNDAEVPKEYLPFYQEASARTGIPVDVLIAQHRQESGFNAGAVGKAGEIGVGQIKPSTAAAPGGGVQPIDPATLKDPRTNINFAADYLKSRLPPGADAKDPAALRVALARYNGGGDPNYVANVTRYLPAPAPQAATGAAAPGAPYKVASAGPTVPAPAPGAAAPQPAPGSVAAETAGLKVPPGATPPAPAPAPPAPDPNTFVYHPAPIPEDFKALVTGNLSPAQIQNLEAAKAGALENFKLAQATGDPKSAAAAQDAYNKVLESETTLLSGQTDKARDFLKEFYKNDFDQQKTLFDTNHKAMLDRATKSEELQQTADINLGQDDLKARTADAGEARKVMMLLTQMGPQLENLPNGVVGTLVDKYPELVPLLQAGGINPQQATNIQLLQSARAYLSLLQKPPASGSLRTAEMSNLASYTPATLNTPQARQEMLARLLATNQRIIDERNFASNYFGRTDPATGKPIYNVRGLDEKIDAPLKLDANGNRTADSGLGPVVPEPPPKNAPAEAHQAYQKYVAQLRNNFPYWTYRQRTDQTTRLPVSDKNGAPVFDRVLRIKGVNDTGPGG
jgi:soluble lytic murein transglycosylase-like protein